MTQAFSRAIELSDFNSKFGKENGWQAYKHYQNIIGSLSPILYETLGMPPKGFEDFLQEMNEKRAKILTGHEKRCIANYLKNSELYI